MSQELKQYTRSEVEKNTSNAKLLIIHDKVYDVTVFLNEHPGGEEILLDHSNKDASEDFDDVGHSADAFELMKKYLVGEIVEHERTKKQPKKGWVAGYDSQTPPKQVTGPGFPLYLLIGAIVVVNVAVYLFSSSRS